MCEPVVVFVVRVIIACIGVVVGIAAAFVFGITFDNPHAAGWAAVSGIFALVSLVVMILVYKKKLKDCSLTLFALVGATGIVLGTTTFVLYIVLGVYDKDDPPLPKSYYIVPVWAFMLIKHSAVMAWVTSYELVKMFRQQNYYQPMSASEEGE